MCFVHIKESLNSDDEPFQQYQKHQQQPLTLNHGTQKDHESHGEGNSGPGLRGNTS
jgi:hypothetical protein